ncbi:conserved Plasmodium membrane protein, unknown function [Plasmodium gallinaceum]|uniref:Uncharacterized protein n=1 Tax=Plasmodium gallinaceum TaxID=5849 RepID=A0A1J1GS22_PLAGA|nr:conserved Plasmodium membrane protein, unknown function [Plasmodium gallinaceum]CRG94104.1 conserved Plasmodium membrane protein, unknown function [Plasmodium gallinaceum]
MLKYFTKEHYSNLSSGKRKSLMMEMDIKTRKTFITREEFKHIFILDSIDVTAGLCLLNVFLFILGGLTRNKKKGDITRNLQGVIFIISLLCYSMQKFLKMCIVSDSFFFLLLTLSCICPFLLLKLNGSFNSIIFFYLSIILYFTKYHLRVLFILDIFLIIIIFIIEISISSTTMDFYMLIFLSCTFFISIIFYRYLYYFSKTIAISSSQPKKMILIFPYINEYQEICFLKLADILLDLNNYINIKWNLFCNNIPKINLKNQTEIQNLNIVSSRLSNKLYTLRNQKMFLNYPPYYCLKVLYHKKLYLVSLAIEKKRKKIMRLYPNSNKKNLYFLIEIIKLQRNFCTFENKNEKDSKDKKLDKKSDDTKITKKEKRNFEKKSIKKKKKDNKKKLDVNKTDNLQKKNDKKEKESFKSHKKYYNFISNNNEIKDFFECKINYNCKVKQKEEHNRNKKDKKRKNKKEKKKKRKILANFRYKSWEFYKIHSTKLREYSSEVIIKEKVNAEKKKKKDVDLFRHKKKTSKLRNNYINTLSVERGKIKKYFNNLKSDGHFFESKYVSILSKKGNSIDSAKLKEDEQNLNDQKNMFSLENINNIKKKNKKKSYNIEKIKNNDNINIKRNVLKKRFKNLEEHGGQMFYDNKIDEEINKRNNITNKKNVLKNSNNDNNDFSSITSKQNKYTQNSIKSFFVLDNKKEINLNEQNNKKYIYNTTKIYYKSHNGNNSKKNKQIYFNNSEQYKSTSFSSYYSDISEGKIVLINFSCIFYLFINKIQLILRYIEKINYVVQSANFKSGVSPHKDNLLSFLDQKVERYYLLWSNSFDLVYYVQNYIYHIFLILIFHIFCIFIRIAPIHMSHSYFLFKINSFLIIFISRFLLSLVIIAIVISPIIRTISVNPQNIFKIKMCFFILSIFILLLSILDYLWTIFLVHKNSWNLEKNSLLKLQKAYEYSIFYEAEFILFVPIFYFLVMHRLKSMWFIYIIWISLINIIFWVYISVPLIGLKINISLIVLIFMCILFIIRPFEIVKRDIFSKYVLPYILFLDDILHFVNNEKELKYLY